MYRRLQKRGRAKRFYFYLICSVILISASALFAENAPKTQAKSAKYKFFQLKHITQQQAKGYISSLRLGTVSLHPEPKTILVTGQPEELSLIAGVISVVDSKNKYEIEPVLAAVKFDDIPDFTLIEQRIGDITVGTFNNPPQGENKNVIIDTLRGAVISIAPVGYIEKIEQAIDQIKKAPQPMDEKTQKTDQTPKLSAGSPEELFGNLMSVMQGNNQGDPDKMQQFRQSLLKGKEISLGQESETPAEKVEKKVDTETAVEQKTDLQKGIPEPATLSDSIPGVPKIVSKYKPVEDELANEMLDLNLPERLMIVDLLSLMGEYLGLDYLYEPEQLKGKDEVTLRLRGPIKVKDLYPLVESVLKFKGLAMSRKGNLVVIIPVDQALEMDPLIVDDTGGEIKYGQVVVTRIFKLKHIDSASAQNLLEGLKLGVDINTSISDSKMIIVTGYAYRMERIENLLELVDKPGEKKQFRFRQLKYTMATNLATKLQNLADQLGTVSLTVSATTQQQTPPASRARTPGRAVVRKPTTPSRAQTPSQTEETTVYLEADERTNRVLMIGLNEQLEEIEGLIDTLDVEQQDLRTLRLYEINYVGAEEVKLKLEELGIISRSQKTTTSRSSRSTIRSTSPTKSPTTRAPVQETPSAGFGPEGTLSGEPQVVIIESTNSLLVNATAEQHAQVSMIIGYVDSETLDAAIPYEVYPLENQEPGIISEVLNQLIQETVKDKEGKIEKVVKKTEDDIVIVPDDSTFSLIVYASRKNQEWISKLIKTLDKRRPQVLIDVSLVQISRDDLFEYDLNIIANARDIVTGNVGIRGTTLPIEDSTGDLEFGWNLLDADGNANGKAQGYYSSDKIQALLSAMDSKNYGRVLAQPKVLVNDNEEGMISTSQTTYVAETSTTIVPGSDSPTTSTTFAPYDAKIELTITPNISEGDLLRLKISMTREDFTKQTSVPPDYDRSNLDTTVTVPDGSTVILGGLTKLKQSKGGSKVPILGDMPLVGALFRSVSNSDEADKLYMFVKATIIRPDDSSGYEQLKRISSKNRSEFETEESDFQKRESWPGIEPEPMDPLQVLNID